MNSSFSTSNGPSADPGRDFLPIWPGYFIAGTMFVISFVGYRADKESLAPLIVLLNLAGWIYWLICIGWLHATIEETTAGKHPIKPGRAIIGHFVPFFNLFWVFIWSNAIARFVRSHAGLKMIGGWFGIPLALSILMSGLMLLAESPGELLGAVMYASPFLLLQFAVGHYLTFRVRRAIARHLDL
jgi:hypothetical protein